MSSCALFSAFRASPLAKTGDRRKVFSDFSRLINSRGTSRLSPISCPRFPRLRQKCGYRPVCPRGSQSVEGAEEPLALIRQREYMAEPNPGEYFHVKAEPIIEWPPEFLSRPRRTRNTIPDFLSPLSPRVQSERIDVAGPVVAKQERNIIGVQSKPESRCSCEISAGKIHDPFLLTVRN